MNSHHQECMEVGNRSSFNVLGNDYRGSWYSVWKIRNLRAPATKERNSVSIVHPVAVTWFIFFASKAREATSAFLWCSRFQVSKYYKRSLLSKTRIPSLARTELSMGKCARYGTLSPGGKIV